MTKFVRRGSKEFLKFVQDAFQFIFIKSSDALEKITAIRKNFSKKDLEDIVDLFLNDLKVDDAYVVEVARRLDEFAESVSDVGSYSNRVSANRGFHVIPEDIQKIIIKNKINEDQTISIKLLKDLSIIKTKNSQKLKILGRGDLTSKNPIECAKVSKSALSKLEKLGNNLNISEKS